MATVLRGLLIAIVLTVLPVGAGVLYLRDGEEPEPPPEYESTPLASYDTSVVTLIRAAFCELLPDEAVTEALGSASTDSVDAASYDNGERVEVAAGVEDVAHEYGCRVETAAGTEARAWLFAPPVTRARAADLVAEAADRKACEPQPDAPAYGAPSVALVCPVGDRRFASYRGLFGDAWLACSVAAPARVPERELLDRTGRFCVAVAEAAAG